MRQLVTIRTVSELVPIEGADRIELAKVDGWQCVVRKGDFHINDPALYFEIDSLLPSDDERWVFLEQRKFRVKTMRLRGTLSQGLLMPMRTLTDEEARRWKDAAKTHKETLTDILRVQKYEPPMPIGGEQKGPWPSFIQKTDQERIQNIPDVLHQRTPNGFEITEKLDGTSCTFFYLNAHPFSRWYDPSHELLIGACSRNWEMKLDDDNVYAKLWHELGLGVKLGQLGRNIAIQGEIIGPKVQGNKYKRGKQEFYVFDIYDIDNARYMEPRQRRRFVEELGLLHVPLIDPDNDLNFASDWTMTVDIVLDLAEGKSKLFDTQREGLVFKEDILYPPHGDRELLTFKVISNRFLLKNE